MAVPVKSVQRHLSDALAAVKPVPPLDVVLADAAGCILAEDLVVAADLPARAVAACDGYAVRSDETYAAGPSTPVHMPMMHDVWSGSDEPLRLVPGQTIRVSSGATLPLGADAVLPLDHTDRGSAHVRV